MLIGLLRRTRETLGRFFFDNYEYIRDRLLLTFGCYRIVYARDSDGLPLPSSYTRAAVVAIHPDDPQGLPFIINLLQGLAANGFYVLVVATKRLSPAVSEKLLAHCHFLISRFPIGVDFGSYKMGLSWLQQQPFYREIEVLALVNDSLFYPAGIANTIREMMESKGDWLALYENFQYPWHAQGCFQIFRPPVFKSLAFINFWNRYKPISARLHAVDRGEVKLSEALCKRGNFVPYIVYSSFKVQQGVYTALMTPTDSQRTLHRILKLSLGEFYNTEVGTYIKVLKLDHDSFSSLFPKGRNRDELFAHNICTQISSMLETSDPIQYVCLLCNVLYAAPIKRDVCYGGIHSTADVLDLAQGFTREERDAMLLEFRRS